MSYIPNIIIVKEDLEKHSFELENSYMNVSPKQREILEYLNDVLKHNYEIHVGRQILLLCQPDISTFNNDVREQLDKWNVEYGISN
jgi:hypothetical protein